MIVTSTLRMQLDAAGFLKSAAQVAEAVDRDVKHLHDLKTALRDTGASDRLQASMVKLGASTKHIDGMRQAMEKFRAEQGTTGKAWGDLTKEQRAALRTFESATAATMRAVIGQERDLTTALKREADQRHDALLSKEQRMRDALLADVQKAEDRRVTILAAAEASRATVANRELVMRATIEREITANLKTEIKAREGASEAELATMQRIAGLERDARVRAIKEETAAIIAAHDKQQASAAEAVKHGQARAGLGHLVTGTAAGYVSAHAMLRPAEVAMEAGSERQSTLIGARRAGMSPAEIVRAQDLAVKVARDVGNLTATQVLELHKEARSAVQHPEEVFELMPDLARAASALKGMGAQGNIADLVKAGESLGLMGNPERFRHFLDSQIKAQGVMGKMVTTEGTYEAAKYTKSAGATLSDEFLNLTLPSLIQELHGSSAGDAIASLTKRLRGGLAHQHLAVTQLDKMGLLDDPSQVQRAKGSGEIMGYTGKVKGDSLLATDPDRWFNEVFKPAAEKNMGARTMADMNMLLSQTLGSTASNLGRIFIQQSDTFAQHRENNRNAPGLDEQIRMQREDPKVAAQTFHDALDDLGAAVTGPVMGRVGLGLTDLAGYIRNIEDAALAHPNLALGVGAGATAVGLMGSGWLAYQVSTGFGLPAAAGHLSASAMALEGAAAKLGASGATGTAKDLAGAAAPGLGLASKLAIGVPLVGAGLFVADAMVNRRDSTKALIDGGTPDALTVNDNNSMLPGFAAGGFTGSGGRNEPAGIVHKGEYVMPAGPTERHRAILDAIRRGDILPGFANGGMVGGSVTANGVTRVAIATDSSSAAALRQVVGEGMYDALRRIRNEGETAGGGGGLGSGTVGTPMEGGGTMRAGRGPNIRYGRQHVPGGSNGLGRFDGGAPGANGFGLTNAPYTAPLDAKGEGGHLAPRELFAYLKAHGATDNEATMLTGAAGSESSFNPNAIHDVNGKNGPGHGLWGHNDHRINMTGLSWQQQADKALAEVKREYADRVNAAKTPEELADAEMHYERPRGYHSNNPRGGDNYTGRLNTIRRFSHGFGTMGFDPAKPETAPSGSEATGTVPAGPDGIRGHVRGTLKIGDESFAYGSGGVRGSAHIPYGDYPINPDAPGAWGRAHNAMAVNNDGSIWDASLGRMRTGIEMHVAHSANMVTEGCMSFLKDQYPTLKQRVREMVARTGHAYLHVGPGGASITPEAQREAERAVLPQRKTVPADATTPERHAAGVDFDHSSLREGIDHLRTFKAELAGLKGGVRVAIDHTHTHKGDLAAAGRPGQLRTSLNGHYGSDGRSWS